MISPPGSCGATRIGPSIARTTGMPDTSRTASSYPQMPTPTTSAIEVIAPAALTIHCICPGPDG